MIDRVQTFDVLTVNGRPRAIRCRVCGFVSYHPRDIDERYCGKCHVFHDDRQGAPPRAPGDGNDRG